MKILGVVMSAISEGSPMVVKWCDECRGVLPLDPQKQSFEGKIFKFCSNECQTEWSSQRKIACRDGFSEDLSESKAAGIAAPLLAEKVRADFDFEGMDLSVDPAKDFYHYAVGKWIQKNPLPEGYPRWGSFGEISKNNIEKIKNILENGFEVQSHSDHLLLSLYQSFLNLDQQNGEGIAPISHLFDYIHAISNHSELNEMFAILHRSGIDVFFGLHVQPHPKDNSFNILSIEEGILNLGDYEIYLEKFDTPANQNAKKREEYIQYVTRLFTLSGESREDANAMARTVFAFEQEMATHFFTKEERRDVEKTTNLFSIEELQQRFGFPFTQFFSVLEVQPKEFNVSNPFLLQRMAELFDKTDPNRFKLYLRLTCLNRMASALGTQFYDLKFNFHSKVMRGIETAKPVKERAIEACGVYLGDAIGKIYVSKFFSPEKKAKVVEMVNTVREAFAIQISALNWMEPETKARAIKKVQAMAVQVAYPDAEHWTDYEPLQNISAGSPLAENLLEIMKFKTQREFDKLAKPVDRLDWPWSPQTVNACNSFNLNKINFPAGILQYPFFTQDPAVNWGAFGMVICHEIIHSFDDQGCKYDLQGNQKEWWQREDKERFDAHAKLIKEQFDDYSMVFTDGTSQNVRGGLCLGENIADLGGLNIAYTAFQLSQKTNPLPVINGFTPEQRFFLSFAQVWRNKATDEFVKNALANDPHSPPLWRVNGTLSQMPEFRAAFSLPENCPMVIPKEKRSTMWSL